MALGRPARAGSRRPDRGAPAHVAAAPPAYTRSMAGTLPRPGVVVVSDIDLDLPDARRTHTLEVTRWLARLGFAPDLVSRGADPGVDGVRYHAARAGEGTRERLMRVNRRAIGVLLRRRRSAGALYVRHDWAMAPTAVAARLLGYRVVAEVNDLPYGSGAPSSRPRSAKRRLADGVKRRFAAALFRATDEVVAVTEQVASIVRRDYSIAAARVHVIGNGVDVDLFVPRDRAAAARAAGLDPDARHLAFVGLFAPWVDFPCMLEAFARVGATRPDVRLVLVGDGGERPAIEEHAARLGLDGRLVLTGFVRERDRVAELVGASVLGLVPLTAVHARIGGGSPVKLGEYMAAARPVVATALPTSRALLERFAAGVAVEAGSVDEMADALAALLDDPQRAAAMGRAGRQAAEDHLSWQAAVERIAVLLDPDRALAEEAAA